MRGGVADDVEAFGVALGEDGNGRVAVDDVRSVDDLAVDLAGERRLRESGTDRRGDVGNGERSIVVSDGAVGELDVGHGESFEMRKKKCGSAALLCSDRRVRRSGRATPLRVLHRASTRSRCHNHAFRCPVVTLPRLARPTGPRRSIIAQARGRRLCSEGPEIRSVSNRPAIRSCVGAVWRLQ